MVDLVQPHIVGDEGIQRDLTGLSLLHIARQFGAPFDAAEGAATPDPARHQLERTSADLLTGAGHTDDHRFAPTLVGTFQRGAHQLDVADTLE